MPGSGQDLVYHEGVGGVVGGVHQTVDEEEFNAQIQDDTDH